MNKKGQVSTLLWVIFVVLVTPIILYSFNDTLTDVRDSTLESLSDNQVLEKAILIAIKPILWGFWIFLSVAVIFFTVNSSTGFV
jgi:hypothetical protein